MKKSFASGFFGAALVTCSTIAYAGDIGEVDTAFQFIGPNHKIKVSGFPDPQIEGVTCFISRPITGGVMGGLGLAEDPSDASIACRQTGPINVKGNILTTPKGDLIIDEKRSAFFKTLNVQRFFDAETGSFVYLTYSTKLINGSPKNSISVVTPQSWEGAAPKGINNLPKPLTPRP